MCEVRKTLPKYTIRRLVLNEKSSKKPQEELIKNIEKLRLKIGNDYLEIVLKRSSNIDDNIIIAVENKK